MGFHEIETLLLLSAILQFQVVKPILKGVTAQGRIVKS